MILYVHVRRSHIETGIPGHRSKCPVALATREAFKEAGIPTGLWSGCLTIDGTMRPAAVNEFVWKFDHGEEVEPFCFQQILTLSVTRPQL